MTVAGTLLQRAHRLPLAVVETVISATSDFLSEFDDGGRDKPIPNTYLDCAVALLAALTGFGRSP